MGNLTSFLLRLGLADAARVPLSEHASSKKYWRITKDGKSYVVLGCEPKTLARLYLVYTVLHEQGIRVATIHECDAENGFALFEDLGDTLLTNQLGSASISRQHDELFINAMDILIRIQQIPVEETGLPIFSIENYILELDTLTDWYLPAVTGKNPQSRVVLDFFDSLRAIKPFGELLPPSFVHRDFYSGNVMVTNASGNSDLALIDFEDAGIGSPTYDLVSLLQDLRRDVDPQFEITMKKRYQSIRAMPQEEFEIEYAVFGALRAMRVLGLWRRLAVRDHKPHFLAYEPFTLKHLEINLSHPALITVKRAYKRCIKGGQI